MTITLINVTPLMHLRQSKTRVPITHLLKKLGHPQNLHPSIKVCKAHSIFSFKESFIFSNELLLTRMSAAGDAKLPKEEHQTHPEIGSSHQGKTVQHLSSPYQGEETLLISIPPVEDSNLPDEEHKTHPESGPSHQGKIAWHLSFPFQIIGEFADQLSARRRCGSSKRRTQTPSKS